MKKPNEIEVLEESPIFFKLFVKDVQAPLKFNLMYKEAEYLKGRKLDLAVYFSFTNKEPSSSDCFKASINVNLILITKFSLNP